MFSLVAAVFPQPRLSVLPPVDEGVREIWLLHGFIRNRDNAASSTVLPECIRQPLPNSPCEGIAHQQCAEGASSNSRQRIVVVFRACDVESGTCQHEVPQPQQFPGFGLLK